MKDGAAVVVVVRNYWGREFLRLRRVDGSSGKPCAFRNPNVVELSGLSDSENALRDSGAKSFIDNAEVEGHWNRRCFVRASIVKLAVDHDRNRNDSSFFARGRKLNQSSSARALVDGGLASVLGSCGLCGEPD